MNDPISDMLTRIRNAIAVGKSEVNLPHSKTKESIAKLLKANSFVYDVSVTKGDVAKQLTILINAPGSNANISDIKRLSRPGRRMYSGAGEIPKIKQGRGIVIVSTSSGLMTDKQAREKKVGGELICSVY